MAEQLYDGSADYVLLTRLADEFAARYRSGERPPLQEYIDRYPALADDIRELFPAMVEIEQGREDHQEAAKEEATPPGPALEQLGDFRILREVGKGGMGIVYEAEQVSLGRHVALKVLPRNLLLDARAKRRFEREAKAAARLHHTNIVPVFGVGEQDGLPYYVMQFIQGLGLDEVLEELKRLQHGHAKAGTVLGGGLRVSRTGGQAGNPPGDEKEVGGRPRRELTAAHVARSLFTGAFEQATDGQDKDEADGGQVLAAVKEGSVEVAETGTPTPAAAPSSSDSLTLSSSSVVLPGRGRDGSKSRQPKPSYWQSVASIGVQVAEALEYAHKQGVLHRDIKPSNLLLDTQGTVWVTDFGLAKAADDQQNLTDTGDLLGTLRYMPPETFEGKSDARGDVYSLGLTLYEMLACRPAFDENERHRLIKQMTHAEPARLGKLNRAIPRDLETIVHKAIDRDPGRRYPQAADLAADLQRFLDDEPIHARRTSTRERLWRWCRRNPVVASLLAALAVAILAGFALVTWKGLAEARANQLAQEARERADEARLAAEQISAGALLDAAINQADGGDLDRAMLTMVRGLELAEHCGDADLQRVFRMNLTGWQSRLFRLRARLGPHGDWVSDVAYSPDGRQIATASPDQLVRLWDTATGRQIGEPLRHDYPVWAVSYSPDGRTLVTGCGSRDGLKGEARLWDVAHGKPLGPPFLRGPHSGLAAFSADGCMMLTAGPEEAQVWRAADGQPVGVAREAEQPLPSLVSLTLRHPAGLETALFSPDGKLVLTGGKDGTARLWRTDTGRPWGPPLRHGTSDSKRRIQVSAAAFSPDGRWVVTGSQVIDLVARRHVGGEARLWRVATGEPVGLPWPHRGSVKAISFSRDGQRVLTGGIVAEGHPTGKYGGEARLWDVATGKPIGPTMEQAEPIWAVAISPDNRTLLTGCENELVQFWSAATALPLGKAFRVDSGNALAVAFGPDGRTAVAAHTTTQSFASLFEVPPGRGIALAPWDGAAIGPLAFSPDGRLLLANCGNRSLRLWDVATGQPRGDPWAKDVWVDSIAFSFDGRLAATGVHDRDVRLWDVARGRLSGSLPPQPTGAHAVAFSPDDRLLVAVYPYAGEAQLWHVASGKPLGPPLRQPGVRTAAFSPDGHSVLLGGGGIHSQTWDVTSGQPLGSPLQTDLPAVTLAFSPDGQRLVMTRRTRLPGWDHDTDRDAAHFWLVDRGTGELLVPPLQQSDGVSGAAFSPDGKIIATGGSGGTLMLWDTATGRRLGPVLQHPAGVRAVAFHPGGAWLATGCGDGIIRFWDVPAPATGDSELIRQWVQARTASEMDTKGRMRPLKPEALYTLRRNLEATDDEPFPRPTDAKP